MKKNIKLLICLLITDAFSLFSKQNGNLTSTTKDHSITVFVHGTFPVRKLLQYSIGRFLVYCPQGISLAKNLPTYYHFHKMAQGCVDRNPELYSLEQFYTFGWKSEHVYDWYRAQAAADLTKQLQDLVNNYYHKYHVIPKIRLLGFSHGGNVILHTANYLPLIVNCQHIEIEVWLFGTPVQLANKHLVNSENFSKVYSFYSKSDWIQRMDPQGLRGSKIDIKHIWSDRMFDQSDRCVQVEFTVNGKSISHSYYRSILKYFPVLQQMVEEKCQGIDLGCITIDLKK